MLREQCLGAMRLGRRSSGRPAPLAALASCVAALALAAPAHAGMGFTTRESLTATGGQANDASYRSSLSADGSLLAFQSDATNLVPGDTNGHSDIFVRDRTKGTVTRVSVASDGTEANNDVEQPAISGDGRYVAFTSAATNLDPIARNGYTQVYVHDRLSGTTRRVSKTPTGGEAGSSGAPSISRDGRYVAFSSQTDLVSVVPGPNSASGGAYVYDTQTDKTVLVSVTSAGNPARGTAPSISADGRYVAFFSNEALVPGDTNGVNDVYIRDRDADGNGIFDEAGAGKTATTLVSVASDGTSAGNASSAGDGRGVPLALSADGRQVAFTSEASNLVAGDTNSTADVFARDLRAGKTTRISVASDGSQANDASGGFEFSLAISADGRRVAFASNASNLVAGDTNSKTDVFVRDRDADANGTFDEAGAGKTTTTRESVSTDGGQGNANSGGFIQQRFGQFPGGVSLTEDGTGLAFGSMATNLVADDTNSQSDVFGRFAVAQTGGGGNPPPGGGSSPPPGGGGNPPPGGGSSPPPGGGGNPPPGGGSSPPPGGGGNPPPGGGGNPPPGGGGSPPPGGGGAGRHTTAPVVSGFGLTNNPFVVGGSTPIFGTAAAKNTKNTTRHKLGTTLRYTLSEAATVRIVITQARSGRRRGKRCVAPTRSLRRARKCTRTLTRGTLTRTSHRGKNRVAFSGRIGSRKLAPGRYQATLTATDPAKITSKPRTITFMIVRR